MAPHQRTGVREGSALKMPNRGQYLPPEICDAPLRTLMVAKLPDPFWKITTHQNCLHNQVRSAMCRVLAPVHKPLPAIMIALYKSALALSRSLPPVQPIGDFEELILRFPKSKHKLYRRALESLCDYGLTERDWQIKAFVKSEKLQIEQRDGDPRMIQARSPRFNLELGFFTRAIEANLYSLMDPMLLRMGIPKRMIAKGMNLEERANHIVWMWTYYQVPVSISLDLSRWDMHVGLLMVLMMHVFYLGQLRDPWLQALLEKQLRNRAATSQGLRWRVTGGVMSGDMTTALGNCAAVVVILISLRGLLRSAAAVIVYGSCAETLHAELWDLRPLLEIIVQYLRGLLSTGTIGLSHLVRVANPSPWFLILDDGDDHVVITEKAMVPLLRDILPRWWSMLGHVLKVEGVVEEVHQIQFCQHKPFLTTMGWTMCPDPYKVLATSTVVTGVYLDKPQQYLKTIWEARALLHQGVPVLGPMFDRLRHLPRGPGLTAESRRKVLSGVDYQLMRSPHKEIRQVDLMPEQRVMFWQQWGITPTEQLLMENQWNIPIPSMANLDAVTLYKWSSLTELPS